MRLTMKLTVAFLFVCCLAGLLWEETARADRAVSQSDSVRRLASQPPAATSISGRPAAIYPLMRTIRITRAIFRI